MRLAREREDVVRFARRLVPDGLVVGTSGNLSARAGELVAITPSGLDYGELTPELVCVVGVEGEPVEAALPPSTELPLHLAAYRATGTGAVVHTHSAYATVLSTVVRELPPLHYLVAELGGSVRVAPYATPGTEELGRVLVDSLAGRSAALLQSHGAIAIGESLPRAYARSVLLEWLSALYYRARLLGEPSLLSDDEVERLIGIMRDYGRAPRDIRARPSPRAPRP